MGSWCVRATGVIVVVPIEVVLEWLRAALCHSLTVDPVKSYDSVS